MKTIILDFDGTLADTRRLIVRTMQAVIRELGLPERGDSECAAMIGLPLKQTFTDLIPMTDEMGSLCEQTYRRIFFENVNKKPVPVFPHVLETIQRMAADGLVLTIASSRSRSSLMHFVENMHIAEHIGYILGADDVSRAKPDPEPVLLTLRHFSASPADALVVGDTTFDIEMGRRAGCRTCGVTYGNHTREQLQAAGANYIIDDFAELYPIAHDL